MKTRLDVAVVKRGLTSSRSQAENYIKLGVVSINGKKIRKPGHSVSSNDQVVLAGEQYVSRAALKLASIADTFSLDFRGKIVLDVGSSTGGFTDYALQHGAEKVIAVDVGTEQLHPTLRANPKIELHEKTDIRDVNFLGVKSQESRAGQSSNKDLVYISSVPDIVVIDVSFISLTNILTHVSKLMSQNSILVAMCKPQFEAGKGQTNKGIIKNSSIRRQVLKDFEHWLGKNDFIIKDKADSQVAGTKGNIERFYKLKHIA